MEKKESEQVVSVTPEEMEEFFSGGSSEIKELLELLEKKEVLKEEIKTASSEVKNLEKDLEYTKKSIVKDQKDSVEKALEEELKEENAIINETNSKIKKIKNNRNKAKEKGIKGRIEEETKDLVETNKKLNNSIRKSLREAGLPMFCNSTWYYVMYYTQGIAQLLIKIAVFAMGLFVIPFVVVKIVNPWFLLKGILFIGIAGVFFVIYITIYLLTKDKDIGTLEEICEYREKLIENKRKIRKIKNGIRKDKDEERYDLGGFDEELEKLEIILKDVTEKKQLKIKKFEETSKIGIVNGVEEKYSETIDTINENMSYQDDMCKEKTKKLNEIEEILKNDYEKFLPKTYLNVGCISRMLNMIEEGSAKNIGEAFEGVK